MDPCSHLVHRTCVENHSHHGRKVFAKPCRVVPPSCVCWFVNPMNTIDISTINHRIQLFINQLVFLKPDSRPLNWWSFPKNGFPRRLKPVHHPPEATQKETPQGSTLNQGIRKMKIWTPNLFVNPKLCPSQVPSYLKSPITIFLGKSPFSLEKSRFSLEKSGFSLAISPRPLGCADFPLSLRTHQAQLVAHHLSLHRTEAILAHLRRP